jgi:uncharacterized protein YndB with AHSA1/START domain
MGEAAGLDPEPGGRLRVGYPNGQVAGGRVVAVEPDRRIVFTWGLRGRRADRACGSSTVEITLEPVDDGTEVRLRWPPGTSPTRRAGRNRSGAAWPTGAGSGG